MRETKEQRGKLDIFSETGMDDAGLPKQVFTCEPWRRKV
jgi:hypothetical protein